MSILLMMVIVSCSAGAHGHEIFKKSEFAARRARLMEKIGDGVVVLLGARTPSSGRKFFQNNDFFYFSGVEVPDASLIIDGLNKESIIFFTISEDEAKGEGIPLDFVISPQKSTGIEKALPLEQFGSYMTGLSLKAKNFYTLFRSEELMRDNTNEKFNLLQRTMTMNLWDGRLTRELQFVKNLRDKFPQVSVMDCSQQVWDLRKIKSVSEIECIRHAAQIGVKAHEALIRETNVGAKEYELAAVFEFVSKKNGAQDLAYETILMSGPNHAYGHYHRHDKILQDGDFVILDAGPKYDYYVADISSTFPANGIFSPEQKKLYELADGVRRVCLKNYRPGITLKEVGQLIRDYIGAQGYDPDDPKYSGTIRYGGYNHSIGMAVHDFLGYRFDPEEPLAEGFVFACDINWPFPEKELGVRLEDTVVITADGCENLSQGLARTIQEIESLLGAK